jgi:uncharacterized membrane protein
MSSKTKHHPPEGLVAPGAVRAARFLSGLALIVAFYLAWLSFSGASAVGCGPESGCQEVLHSRWAYWFGIPVSVFGLLTYLVLFLGTFRLDKSVPASQQRQVWKLLIPASFMVVGAALWFVAVQWFLVKKFCPYCMTAHASALIAAGLLLWKAPIAREPSKPWQREKHIYVPPPLRTKLVGAAMAVLAVLVAGQTLHQPKTYLEKANTSAPQFATNPVVSSANPSTNQTAKPDNVLASQAPAASTSVAQPESAPSSPPQPLPTPPPPSPGPARVMELFGGQVQLNLSEVPVMGNVDAPNVMLALHDYSCHYCRSMHGPLKAIQQAFSNQLAIISLPMPLDSACNPMVRRTPRAHTNSCEYAKLGLTVWRANRAALASFEDYLFGPEKPPPLAQARERAKSLVGADAFERAAHDPWVAGQLQKDVTIYKLNTEQNKNGAMPQFFVGTNVLFGSMPATTLFQKVVQQYHLSSNTPEPPARP